MRTDPSTSDDFASLRRLLALKRHEQPPPGYYASFSAKVVARIAAGEREESIPWWERWLGTWLARPAAAAAGGLLLGTLMLGLAGSGGQTFDTSFAAEPLAPGMPVFRGPLDLQVTSRIEAPALGWMERSAEASSVAPVVDQSSPFARRFLTRGDLQPASYNR